ncbi:non-ribosomal peptide synthetase/type I polyketide synthase [Moorena sp. SIOASIH]|uniref:non-ribosomal peptide synthetase/type I polyketide synthase n=1 Tax=Moorena sp. SIOASIH TaxID=2607817 RepID=UPI0025FA43DC|nr:non-ribosomal peptide synthetase/type I polyketide synthase [Moorena sp. SIOASIH]
MSNDSLGNGSQLSTQQRLLIALQQANAKLGAVKRAQTEPIAIIGMGCHLPGGVDNPESYWHLLHEGIDAITEVPSARWNLDEYYDPNPEAPGKMYTRCGGFLQQPVDQFDSQFFGISPREAVKLDPQQRLLLEVVWEAIENAGLSADELRGTQTGVFVGLSTHDYEYKAFGANPSSIDAYSGLGNAQSIAVGRISYILGLLGPTFQLDTACSSSLVALHLACQSLRSKESNLALVGGVNLMLSPVPTIFFCKTHALSADGRCKTFDAAADGYARGEGCGIVVLKRLSDAIADRDNILALIRGSAINHDGASSGLTVPNKRAQQLLIHQALDNAKVDPKDVSYIEAHGTGTSLGDPIELGAIGAVFGASHSKENPLIVGSLKTNIGHLEAAAGIAGLMKVVLQLQHQKIAPHLHFKQPNPYINWKELPVEVLTQSISWQSNSKGRIAGVSSFGFSGTNAHVVLEEAPTQVKSEDFRERPCHLLTLSAKSEEALTELATRYQKHLTVHQELALGNICFSANTGRMHFNHRLSVVASSVAELSEKLAGFSDSQEVAGVYLRQLPTTTAQPKIAFLFTGQGSQIVNMGRQLYEQQPVFRKTLSQCDRILGAYQQKPLLSVLYPEPGETSPIDETAYTQPALFAIEYALFQLWKSWGIKPDVVMGHSVGEYVAACVAGVFSLEDGLKLIAHRGRLMQQLPSLGEMVAVMASKEKVNQLIAPYTEEVAVAAINGPVSTVISGAAEAIKTVTDSLEAEGIKTKQLQVSHAFHSPLMEPMLAEFEAVASQITYNQPQIPLISNVTGARADQSIATGSYWVNHVRQPVAFAQSMETLHQLGYDVFLEIGSKPILLGMATQCLPEGAGVWLPSLRPGQEDWQQMLQSLAQLYVRGVKVDWLGFDQDYSRSKVVLPTYPWQRQRYWIETDNSLIHKKQFLSNPDNLHPLLGQRLHLAGLEQQIRFECLLSPFQPNYLKHHCIFSVPVFPAAAYLEIALAAGNTLFNCENLILEDVVIQQALILPEDEIQTIQVILTPQEAQTYSFQIFSLDVESSKSEPRWTLHVQGKLLAGDKDAQPETTDLKTLKDEYNQQISVQDFYKEHQDRGLDLGYCFQAVQQLWRREGKALGQIQLPETLVKEATFYQLHPVLLDASFQVFGATLDETENQDTYLPVQIKRLQLHRRIINNLWTEVEINATTASRQTLTGEVCLLDEQGVVVAVVEGLTVLRTSRQALLRTQERDLKNWLYQIHWQPQSTSLDNQSIDLTKPGSWLLFCPPTGIGKHLAESLKQQGHHCILVTPGENYQQLESQHYQINPTQGSEFPRLLQESLEQQPPLQGVVHLWSLQETLAPLKSTQELQKSQELGCGSVLHLVQAIVKNQDVKSPTLWLVTQGSQSVANQSLPIQFQQAPLWGLGRVIAQEHRELQCRCLDLDPTVEENQAVAALLQELLCPGDENQIAYRQQVRYVARLERQQKALTSKQVVVSMSEAANNQVSIQSEFSYLITGGLGALGLHSARWMVEQGARHLVLTGRKQPSVFAQQTIQELQEAGAQVLVLCGDISEEEDVTKILEEIKVSLPTLRGVIHAAGVLDDGLLSNMSWEQFTRVMAPKVQGAWHLHSLTQNLPLDFFVCFSSIASLLGSPAQGNYAAANAFMDALAHYRQGIGLPGLSINWGPWADGGMASRLESQHLSRMRAQGITPITPDQGLQALAKLLGQKTTQVGVLPINWSQFLEQLSGGIKMPLLEAFSLAETTQAKDYKLLERLEASSPTKREKLLITHLQSEVAQVLGMTAFQIDVQQPLNTMGLDSLMAVELRNRVQSDLGVDVPIVKFIEDISIVGLATEVNGQLIQIDRVQGLEQDEDDQNKTEILQLLRVRPDILNVSQLSYGQKALWFLWQLAPLSHAYNRSFPARICSVVDITAMEKVFRVLRSRHPILRTTFPKLGAEPIQQVHDNQELDFLLLDASSWSEDELKTKVVEAHQLPFDLERGPVMRVRWFTRSNFEHILLLTIHHIACDGWSIDLLIQELPQLYQAQKAGVEPSLPPLKHSYQDYVRWQRDLLEGTEGERLWNYWQQQLAGELPALNLPTDRLRKPIQTYNGASHHFKLSDKLTKQLKELAQSSGATLYTILLAAFQVLLYRYTGQEDILVGSPTSGRTQSEFAGIMGYFVDPVVMRANLSENLCFKEFLTQVRQTVLEALTHQDYPFALLVEKLQPHRDPSRSPIFQVSFALQQLQKSLDIQNMFVNEIEKDVDWAGLKLRPFEIPQQEGQFDLTLEMVEGSSSVQGTFKYNTDLFDGSTIKRMATHFQNLLSAIVNNPQQIVSELPLLSAEERHQLLVEWNDTASDYPKEKCLHQLFSEQVEKTPDAVAVLFNQEQLTYQQLNQRANQLAHHLQNLGVGPEVLVGICVERSLKMVVGMLGILKAGSAYVPLDPNYPQERLSYMLADSGVEVLLTQQSLLESLPSHTAQMVCLDSDWGAIEQYSGQNLDVGVTSDNLAYVIYTSGSTGKPKGTMILHSGVGNYLSWCTKAYNVADSEGSTVNSSIGFDATITSLFSPFLVGRKVVLLPEEGEIEALKAALCSGTKFSLVKITPAHLEILSYLLAHEQVKIDNKAFIIGGEALSANHIKFWQKYAPQIRLINEYGPTETVVGCCIYEVGGKTFSGGNIPIGRPISNTKIYILDSHLEPVAIGVPGELYIGGDGLARGYLNRPELTSEKFIPNPFCNSKSQRLYKTGDLARYLRDGNIEFLGRIDNQVKIRGFRIELGEIEAVLSTHPQIQQTVVIAREDIPGNKRLVAYYISEEESLTTNQVREFLKQKLPDYMVPSAFVTLDTLPLTPNGKVDRKSLPAPDGVFTSVEEYVAPRTPNEEIIANIFAKVLGVQDVGIHDNFFELGGHSLLAVRLMSQIKQQFQINLPLATLFQSPTIEQLASLLGSSVNTQNPILVGIKTSGNQPPLFCIHPLGGNLLCYAELARHLDQDYPVYGLQSLGLDGQQQPLTSVEEMASHYIQAIQQIQPQGSYHLIGWSFGGVIAYEMAQQLQTKNTSVALLTLIDSYVPTLIRKPSEIDQAMIVNLFIGWWSMGGVIAYEMAQQLQAKNEPVALLTLIDSYAPTVIQMPSEIDQAMIVNLLAQDLGGLYGQELDISHETLRQLEPDEQVLHLFEQGKQQGILPSDLEIEQMRSLWKVLKANITAYYHYKPKAYPGSLLLINASQTSPGVIEDPTHGWGSLVNGDIQTHTITGDHYTIIKAPQVEALTTELNKYLLNN